jgi:hypothetical protein
MILELLTITHLKEEILNEETGEVELNTIKENIERKLICYTHDIKALHQSMDDEGNLHTDLVEVEHESLGTLFVKGEYEDLKDTIFKNRNIIKGYK